MALEAEGDRILRNVGNHLPGDTASYPTRLRTQIATHFGNDNIPVPINFR
jgi:hypothetical protein